MVVRSSLVGILVVGVQHTLLSLHAIAVVGNISL